MVCSQVAEKLEELRADKILCVIAEKANEDLQERCASIGDNDVGIDVVILDSADGDDFHTDMRDRESTIRSETWLKELPFTFV